MISNKMPSHFAIDQDWLDFLSANGNVIAFDGKYAVIYRQENKRKVKEYVHHIVADAVKGLYVDHINGNELDNRRCNLRILSPSMSNGNRKLRKKLHNGVELLQGVSYNTDRKKYTVKVKDLNGGKYFDCPHQANMRAVELSVIAYGDASVFLSR